MASFSLLEGCGSVAAMLIFASDFLIVPVNSGRRRGRVPFESPVGKVALRREIDDHLARAPDSTNACAASIIELAPVGQSCRLPKNHAVMRLIYAGEQRHEGKYTRVCGAAKRKRS